MHYTCKYCTFSCLCDIGFWLTQIALVFCRWCRPFVASCPLVVGGAGGAATSVGLVVTVDLAVTGYRVVHDAVLL